MTLRTDTWPGVAKPLLKRNISGEFEHHLNTRYTLLGGGNRLSLSLSLSIIVHALLISISLWWAFSFRSSVVSLITHITYVWSLLLTGTLLSSSMCCLMYYVWWDLSRRSTGITRSTFPQHGWSTVLYIAYDFLRINSMIPTLSSPVILRSSI